MSDVRYSVGLDLGKAQDYSALAALEWPATPAVRWRHTREPVDPAAVGLPHHTYGCRTLYRWPLGTPYTAIARSLPGFLKPLDRPLLVVDETGVGGAVAEMIVEECQTKDVGGGFASVTITGGSEVNHAGPARWRVPKRQLVSVLQVLLQTRRLHISSELQFAPVLVKELQTFKVKVSEAGNESFEAWRERDHDDLVLAVALAAWGAECLDLNQLWGGGEWPTAITV